MFRVNPHRIFYEGSDLGAKFLKQKLLNRNSRDGAH